MEALGDILRLVKPNAVLLNEFRSGFHEGRGNQAQSHARQPRKPRQTTSLEGFGLAFD